MSLSTVAKAPRWSPVTVNKINGASGKNVVLHRQFIIILPLYALNNKNTLVASWAKRVISAWQSVKSSPLFDRTTNFADEDPKADVYEFSNTILDNSRNSDWNDSHNHATVCNIHSMEYTKDVKEMQSCSELGAWSTKSCLEITARACKTQGPD